MKLEGRTALVTGAARRLGRSIAEALAARGARVAVHHHRSRGEAEVVVRGIRERGGTAESIIADLALDGVVPTLITAVEERLGPIDVLVNNASIFVRTPLDALDAAAWDAHLTVNLRTPYLLAVAVGRAMRRRGAGKIVNLTDIAAERPYRHYLPYSVSKAGLAALTRGLAKELAPEVQVSCVAPGPILPPSETSDDDRNVILDRTPLGRFGAPADIASAVLYLIDADFVTGATLTVDGGRSLV